MNKFFILLAFFCFSTIADTTVVQESGKLKFYRKVFPTIISLTDIEITDPISDKPINKKIHFAHNSSGKNIGYIREVVTSTGCNSACLPVSFTLFYDKDKSLIKLLSKVGLSKIYHANFNEKDYQKLDLILMLNPDSYKTVKHPTDMVDALSGATKLIYRNDVVKGAAYSCLRINSYHQQTLKFLNSI